MKSNYPYILAIIFGLAIPFIPEINPFPVILGFVYFVTGSLFGFLWPKESWRWGLWITGPMIVLVGLSVLFAGNLEIFLQKDLPILFLGLISTCLGSLLLSWIKLNRVKHIEK